jgi:GxxExxY protein
MIDEPEGPDRLTYKTIGLAMRVHSTLGPGLLERVYQACLSHELTKADLPFSTQVPLPVSYDGIQISTGYRADVIVDNRVVLELKSAEKITPLHEAQLLTYMRLSGCRIGLLINFNVVSLKQGIARRVL